MTTIVVVIAIASVALLGSMVALYFARATPVDTVRWLGAEEQQQQLDATSPFFVETFRLLTNTPLVGGNRMTVLTNGDGTFPRLWDDLGKAESLIAWQVFWFKPGRLADRALEVLSERARAGVRVFCLLDAFGSRGLGDRFVQQLRDAGVEVAIFRPLRWRNLYKVQQRMHVRSIVIDGRVGYTGGFGIDDRWAGDGRSSRSWRDTNLRVEGPVTDQLQVAFVENWAEATGELILGRGVFTIGDRAPGEGQEAGVLHGVPSLGSTAAERMFVLSILGARERLYVTNAYFVPDRAMRRLLVDAVARGVDVRILTPGPNTDRKSAWLAGRAHYEQLLEAGVRIYHYRPSMVHAKTLVVDGQWSCVGTVNFDNRSLKLNDEVAIVARDRAIGATLEQLFFDDLSRSDEVALDELRNRPWSDRVAERAAQLVAPIL